MYFNVQLILYEANDYMKTKVTFVKVSRVTYEWGYASTVEKTWWTDLNPKLYFQ